ncbi:recombinase family protein [Niveispirillum cyanobacteriorum]|uniref:recombinase family protein n=1 Tax=Niveispirillum cyanobacteriorum TaxID=1612173 RepID=UPI001FECA5FB|nr:recombinase family protein [Niveispirillum cyanobacteriorum]
MRVFNQRNLDLPRRDRHGDLRWTRATISAIAKILGNPAYAGAFVYGRTRTCHGTCESGLPSKAPRPIDQWRIVVKDRYPAYIDWPTYEKIRTIVADNRAEYMRTKTRGLPATASYCCTASLGAQGADTRCMSVTRGWRVCVQPPSYT